MPSGLRLDLPDGQRWLICPVDDRAAAVVAQLGRVMCLGPGDKGRELYVAVSGEYKTPVWAGSNVGAAVVCCVPEPTTPDMAAVGMDRIAAVVVRESLSRGGLLLHAALAEHKGSAFVMAGPSGVGKTTASSRLPPPWSSLCDDATLVVRDGSGRWWAQPWPTWSRFFMGGPGGSWPVMRALPLRAIFFLTQSPSDGLEPICSTQSVALTLESAVSLAWETYRLTDEGSARALTGEGLRAARALASSIPAYSLKVSIDGRFWEQIEQVLPAGGGAADINTGEGQAPSCLEMVVSHDSKRLVYTGTSMNPTLVEPELLQVEPYGSDPVRPGDIVCFRSPGSDITVVHRIAAVDEHGVRTRGDNNAWDDPWVFPASEIIGRVTAGQRGPMRRRIRGGWWGVTALRFTRLRRRILRQAGSVPHELLRLVAGLGPFDHLLPRSLRPRVVRFEARYRVFLKLLMGQLTVGQYDDRRRIWRTRRLPRLFIDERNLPVL